MTPCVPHDADHCPTCGVARVRSALAAAPRPARSHPEPEDHALELARARARADRADRKETRP